MLNSLGTSLTIPAYGSARYALDNASAGMTEAAQNLAEKNLAQAGNTLQNSLPGPANTAQSIPGNVSSATGLTSDVLALQYSNTQGQAAARILQVSNDTLGRLIDTLA